MSTTSVASRSAVAVPLIAGAAAAVALGVYGRLHDPTGVAIDIAGFSSFQAVKSWLATLAAVLGLLQLASAAALYRGRPQLAPLHRWSGRAAVFVTLPVVAHCLYALGFQYGEPRVLIHSLLGCFFYGAFVVKMLALTRAGAPSWLLPLAGGAVFTGLIGLWLTSALWFFTTFGVIR
ncbi:DUF6529 family protein [Kribbella soli]|uniref:Uncharacterized protein n=1 Tax=Kribbella soli TaxID=1124743 RepID=A0A4R0HIY6_9ACTN|nr:DUF6529 family protein [Kribbella soli]TCC07729.1 hypothetical protein E0H45_17360 [Kribbella soli]